MNYGSLRCGTATRVLSRATVTRKRNRTKRDGGSRRRCCPVCSRSFVRVAKEIRDRVKPLNAICRLINRRARHTPTLTTPCVASYEILSESRTVEHFIGGRGEGRSPFLNRPSAVESPVVGSRERKTVRFSYDTPVRGRRPGHGHYGHGPFVNLHAHI